MKKVLLIMAAALMTMTQCRKENATPNMPADGTVKMTVTVGPGAKTNITDEGRITWTLGDKLYVSDGTKWLGSLDLYSGAGSATGKFTGEISEISDGTTCHFFYLGHDNGMTAPTANTTTDVSISFASQDGSREGAFKYHLGHGIADVTVSEEGVATGAVRKMRTEIAIAHLKLKMNDEDYTGSVTMDVSNTMKVSPGGTFTGSGKGITIAAGTSGDRYVTLIPTEETNVSFSGSATGSMTFGHGIQANNLYGMAAGIEVTLTAAHEYVDLGLPSGLLWATCNVGADSPEDYGWYFMWGSVTEGGDPDCSWANCPGNGGNSSNNVAAFNTWKAANLTNNVLNSGVDAARANWGSDWRMPTTGDWNELYDNTTSAWTNNYNGTGVKGRVFTSKNNGKTLFLPAAGYRFGTEVQSVGSDGCYWSSSPYSSAIGAYIMNFNSGNVSYPLGYVNRNYGLTVRPVRAAR